MPDPVDGLELAKYHLEWWKLAVSALTPLAIAVLTYFITSSLNDREARLRVSEQTLAEKQKTYSRIGEDLNIIYVYAADVGDFRQFTPSQVVDKKRNVDRTFFTYKPYWSADTEKRYTEFMKSAFQTYNGIGMNAKIRSSSAEKKAAYAIDKKPWNADWDSMFTGQTDARLEERYYALVTSFMDDIANSAVNIGR